MSNRLPKDWQEWIADCLMRQIPNQHILDYLLDRKVSQSDAEQAIREAANHPYVRAGIKLAREKYRRDWALKLLQTIRENAEHNQEIDRLEIIDRDTFYNHYQANNRPVILTGMIDHWHIYQHWTPEYFKEQWGDQVVQYTRLSEDKVRFHEEKSLGEFVDIITHLEHANDYYLSYGNYEFNQKPLASMFAEIDKLPELLNPNAPELISGQVFLGPNGTLTDLHFDLANALYAQIYGKKKFTLVPPEYITNIYPYGNLRSMVDIESIDYERFPYYKGAKKYEFTLEPGELMYLPVGWWHAVESEGVSISLSFSNFYSKEEYYLFEDLFQPDPHFPPYDD